MWCGISTSHFILLAWELWPTLQYSICDNDYLQVTRLALGYISLLVVYILCSIQCGVCEDSFWQRPSTVSLYVWHGNTSCLFTCTAYLDLHAYTYGYIPLCNRYSLLHLLYTLSTITCTLCVHVIHTCIQYVYLYGLHVHMYIYVYIHMYVHMHA